MRVRLLAELGRERVEVIPQRDDLRVFTARRWCKTTFPVSTMLPCVGASLHARFGEAVAVLVGDALIVRAFAEVGEHIARQPAACAQILRALTDAARAPVGIAAGQAWKNQHAVDVNAYHHAKTAALFQAAAVCGAISAGGDVEKWRHTGALLGSAYQVADDIADALGESGRLGKPTHQDGSHARPSAVASLGAASAVRLLDQRLRETMGSIPVCGHRESVEHFVEMAAQRLCSKTKGARQISAPLAGPSPRLSSSVIQ